MPKSLVWLRSLSIIETRLTHPSVINDRSSVNCITNSSSSIVHVSLVECCLGINKVVTMYLPFWSFPNNNPQVSRFREVLSAAMERKRGRQSRGRDTALSSGTRSSLARSRIMRADSWEAVRNLSPSAWSGGAGGGGGGPRIRERVEKVAVY